MPTQTKQNPKYFDIVTKEKKKKLLGKNGAIWQIGGAAHAKISNRSVWKTFKFRRPFDKMLVVVRLWFICRMADFINEAQWSPVNWSVCHGNFTRNHFSHGRLQVQIGKKQQHRHSQIWTFSKIYNHTDVKCSLCHSNWMTAKKRKLRGNEDQCAPAHKVIRHSNGSKVFIKFYANMNLYISLRCLQRPA